MTVSATLSIGDELAQRISTERKINMLDTTAIRDYVFSLIYKDLDGVKK